MGTIFGIILSGPRYRLERVSPLPMRELYLDNDHRVHYRVEERTTGVFLSGLYLSASLSFAPTGSAIQSQWLDAGSASFVAAQVFTSSLVTTHRQSLVGSVTTSFTESIVFASSQSLTTLFSGSHAGVSLSVALTEDPPCSAEYVGLIPGADISTALSASLSQSFSSSFTSTTTTGSFSGSFVSASADSVVSMSFITMSVSGFTSSFTASTAVPLDFTSPRSPGPYEVITTGSHLRVATVFTLRSARLAP